MATGTASSCASSRSRAGSIRTSSTSPDMVGLAAVDAGLGPVEDHPVLREGEAAGQPLEDGVGAANLEPALLHLPVAQQLERLGGAADVRLQREPAVGAAQRRHHGGQEAQVDGAGRRRGRGRGRHPSRR